MPFLKSLVKLSISRSGNTWGLMFSTFILREEFVYICFVLIRLYYSLSKGNGMLQE